MSKLKHTPGPWKFSQGFIGARHCMFVSCNPQIYDGMHIHNGENKGEVTDESRANARLIAAAPEMLEALIKILKTEGSIESINNMISIIERATGLKIEEVLECTE